jgi:hypothetical protein
MSLGVVEIQRKHDFSPLELLPHSGKQIFIPDGCSVILGRMGIEYSMKAWAMVGVFKFCALPKNELIGKTEIPIGGSRKYDFHPYWLTLAVREVTSYLSEPPKIQKTTVFESATAPELAVS